MSDIAISSRSCTERYGDFSESVVFHSSYEVSCFLFVFWLGCLAFVFVVCLCWLLLGGWMGDTLGFVSLYSHAWEWTISTNRLMTVRASSAHGTGKKKNSKREQCWSHQNKGVQSMGRKGKRVHEQSAGSSTPAGDYETIRLIPTQKQDATEQDPLPSGISAPPGLDPPES